MMEGSAQPGQVRIRQDIRGTRTDYDEIEVGKDLGSAEFVVTQAQIDEMCDRSRDHHPFYEVDSPFGGTVAPVSMTYMLPRMLFSETYSVRGLFYKWAFEFLSPIKPKVKYVVTAHISEKWIKKDREFVAYVADCRDETGSLIFTTRRAHALDFIKRSGPKIGEGGIGTSDARTSEGKASREPYWDPNWPNDTAAGSGTIIVSPLANRDIKLGSALPSFSIYYSQREFERRWQTTRVKAEKNMHIDYEAARQEGLPAPVAGAPWIMELAFRSAMQFFGAGWVQGGTADLTVVRPTFAGDYVTSNGFVKGVELLADDSRRVLCHVTVENQKGETKVAGTVSGIVQ